MAAPKHPIRAAAWHAIEHAARLARRRIGALVLHAGEQAHLHATGQHKARV